MLNEVSARSLQEGDKVVLDPTKGLETITTVVDLVDRVTIQTEERGGTSAYPVIRAIDELVVAEPAPPPPGPPPTLPDTPPTLFASDSIWNTPVFDRDVALNNDELVETLVAAVRVEQSSFLCTDYGVPLYVVDDHTPGWSWQKVTVETPNWHDPLQAAFNRVPVPDGVQPAAGTDGHLAIYKTDEPSPMGMGIGWDMWQAKVVNGALSTYGAARMLGVSTSPGYFRRVLINHITVEMSTNGVRGSGLPLMGGLVTLAEAHAGVIPHALAMCIAAPVNANYGVFPAHRHDGNRDADFAIPEGSRFRLDPKLDLSKLDLTDLERMLANACQTRGAYIADGGGHTGFYGEIDTKTGGQAWANLLDPKHPTAALPNFPWEHMQLVSMPTG